ncbi:MAG: ribosome maturation factor RimM [Clostridia bacterium]|nr:ribosome maturation factor RimM [Clostridia bacterium]
MDCLEIGKIINTHGLRGEVKISAWTDFPEDFEDFSYALTKNGEKLNIEGIKYQKNNIIVKFREINSISEAEAYKNSVLCLPKEEMHALPPNVYYIADLLGCEVFEISGKKIGIMQDVFSTGSNDVYDIKRENAKNLLVPIIEGVVKSVDTENKKIIIKIPEGLEDE